MRTAVSCCARASDGPTGLRSQEGAENVYAVWDHWLLDTLASWHRQSEASYAIRLDDERGVSPPPSSSLAEQLAGFTHAGRQHVADDSESIAAINTDTQVPHRKRPRAEVQELNTDTKKSSCGYSTPAVHA